MPAQQVVEQHQRHLEQRNVSPQEGDTLPVAQQNEGAEHQHEPLGSDGDCEGEQRDNHDWDGRLGEHRGEVRNRQRLPEQDAAVAPFPVQRVETIKQRDQKAAPHDQQCCEAVGTLDQLVQLHGGERRRATHLSRQAKQAD